MADTKKYWVGVEELHKTDAFAEASQNEFSKESESVDEFLSNTGLSKTQTNRRDFLKFLGFSVTAATVAACETPVINAVPYVNKPEQIAPGIPTYYASTFFDGTDYASVVVKTREGRPIHIKGNSKYGISGGAINARINSSVLSLYDSARLTSPMMDGKRANWDTIDKNLSAELKAATASGKKIVFLTGTIISPSTQEMLDKFSASFGADNFERVTYDPYSIAAIRKANEATFGKPIFPDYDFSKAKTIVSISADFLDSWGLNTQNMSQYGMTRKPTGDWMSKHYQFESRLSLTGSNADKRYPIKPSQEGAVLVALHDEVAKLTGNPTAGADMNGLPADGISKVAKELYQNRGSSLVVCGANDVNAQTVTNAINSMLGNYGKTILTDQELFINQGNDSEVAELVGEMNSGKIGAILIASNINPAYSLPNSDKFIAGLKKVGMTISFSGTADETASRCKYMTPDNHYLESWNDYYPKTGHSALAQPTITRLFDTRQYQDSMMKWSGQSGTYHDLIKSVWQNYSASVGDASILFDDFWFNALRNGSVSVRVPAADVPSKFSKASLASAANGLKNAKAAGGDFEVSLYTKVGIGNGSHSTNPWLQELPDPISKITWDNYIAMNPADVKALELNMNLGQEEPASLVRITIGDKSEVLPVVPQPGQKMGSVSIALGYGRGMNQENIGRSAYRTKNYGGYAVDDEENKIPIGKNLYPFIAMKNGMMSYNLTGATIEKLGEDYPIASTQTQHTLMGRESVVKETTYSVFKSMPKAVYNPPHELVVHEDGIAVMKDVDEVDLWEKHPVQGVGHHWGMNIDLSTCTGCSACVTACHSENNVAVVGKDEIRRGRDMHWMRIDRYYSSDMSLEKGEEEGKGVIDTYREMEVPEYENPATVFMPMMCQHCNHAPCETVCPVAATTHSNEGLNQMTYNRCIGTRYCANNCPFKVRRFNWFNYKAYDKFAEVNPSQDSIARMVLNPDVTVRSRGVMEKCSMCVQRIQAGKLDAKMKGQPVEDGSIITACAEACPTNAISFGDMNDVKSIAAREEEDSRTYHALAEVGVKPSVSYKVKVRNV